MSTSDHNPSGAKPEPTFPVKLQVDVSQAVGFRTIIADGVWLSFDPLGRVHLGFYNEYSEPVKGPLTMIIDKNGVASYEGLPGTPRTRANREFQINVALTQETAAQLITLLKETLGKMGKI
jgi:hypothetical protein